MSRINTFWRALHRAYKFAEEMEVATEEVKDYLNRDVHDATPRIQYMRALLMGMANPNEPGVAFMAHIGGFVAGALLVMLFRKRGVPVFQPAHTRPFAVERMRRGRGSVPEFNPRGRRGPWAG